MDPNRLWKRSCAVEGDRLRQGSADSSINKVLTRGQGYTTTGRGSDEGSSGLDVVNQEPHRFLHL